MYKLNKINQPLVSTNTAVSSTHIELYVHLNTDTNISICIFHECICLFMAIDKKSMKLSRCCSGTNLFITKNIELNIRYKLAMYKNTL